MKRERATETLQEAYIYITIKTLCICVNEKDKN